ncbi:hypothetical protein ACVIKP_006693 [Rhizobium leguminosarum]
MKDKYINFAALADAEPDAFSITALDRGGDMCAIGVVTLSNGERAIPPVFRDQATAPVTAFQCAMARMR